MAQQDEPDLFSLSDVNGQAHQAERSPIQPHLDTLFAEFTRSRSRRSPSPSLAASSRRLRTSIHLREPPQVKSEVDLRALDYVSDYDSHLMCPICHVPFVDPMVLDCDHTFCAVCFDEYCQGADNSPRDQCPTCRAYLLARPRKASRLITNMCNDIKVRCPNEDCDTIHARGCIEQHVTKDCPDFLMSCPGKNCDKKVKRKNHVPDQCIHTSHIECDCGAVIELGRGEWLKHKDEDCPNTGMKCETCSERITVKDYLAGHANHVCGSETTTLHCPGHEYGCDQDVIYSTDEELQFHTLTCPIARMAPHLKKQTQLIQSLNDQLSLAKVRNEVLETGLDKINDLVNTRVLPSLPIHSRASSPSPSSLSIEDIPRGHPPASLTLPAHLRPLTPNPPHAANQQYSELDILNLHTHLSDSITNLSTQMLTLENNLADMDARISMMVLNETFRIKEDLAQQGAGLFSTRAQVQWLLNRERERMQMAYSSAQQQPGLETRPGLARGRSSVDGLGEGSGSARSSFSNAGPEASGSSATAPSPGMGPRGVGGGRRLSGSQERVKL
jgi:hypothetical protein